MSTHSKVSGIVPIAKTREIVSDSEIDRISDVASRLLDADKSAKSKRDYASRLRQWEAFCARHGAAPHPAQPVVIVGWIADMASAGRSMSTIHQSMAALRHRSAQEGRPSPTDDPDVLRAVQGAARLYGRPRKPKKAMTIETLRRLIPTGATPRAIQQRCLLTLGWFSALRRSELSALRARDIEVVEEGLVVHVQRSKTDQSGRGAKVGVPFQSDPKLCPVRSYLRWQTVRGKAEDDAPVFRQIRKGGIVSGDGVSPEWVALTIKQCCSAAGVDPKDFAGHSMRRGFATETARLKKPLESIQKHLRHSSIATTSKYVEEGELFDERSAAMGIV